ncbi:hypothetical protein J6590_023743 [Homalodisca vitripennis]|nr:hypothetical protein J6590_023743 [Homalodisca vitripennis]
MSLETTREWCGDSLRLEIPHNPKYRKSQRCKLHLIWVTTTDRPWCASKRLTTASTNNRRQEGGPKGSGVGGP